MTESSFLIVHPSEGDKHNSFPALSPTPLANSRKIL
ncbi:hypothetical protein A2U01_0117078, partial [Trifolium medium]|nr:hypothetical protein [Trifolium medium]